MTAEHYLVEEDSIASFNPNGNGASISERAPSQAQAELPELLRECVSQWLANPFAGPNAEPVATRLAQQRMGNACPQFEDRKSFEEFLLQLLGPGSDKRCPSEFYPQLNKLQTELAGVSSLAGLFAAKLPERIAGLKLRYHSAYADAAALAHLACFNLEFNAAFNRFFNLAAEQAALKAAEALEIATRVKNAHLTFTTPEDVLLTQLMTVKPTTNNPESISFPHLDFLQARVDLSEIKEPITYATPESKSTVQSGSIGTQRSPEAIEKEEKTKLEDEKLAIRAAVRRTEAPAPGTPVSISIGGRALSLSPAEADAFKVDYVGESSFRADLATLLIDCVAIHSRLSSELKGYRAKKDSSYLWVSHAENVRYLMQPAQSLTEYAAAPLGVARERGLDHKVEAVEASLARLRSLLDESTAELAQRVELEITR